MRRKKRRQLKALRHQQRAQRRPAHRHAAHRPAAHRPLRRPVPRRPAGDALRATPALRSAGERAAAALLVFWAGVRPRALDALRRVRTASTRFGSALSARLAVLVRRPAVVLVPLGALVLVLLALVRFPPLVSAPPQALLALRFAYPEAIRSIAPSGAGWRVFYRNNVDEPYSDGLDLTPEQRFDRAAPAAILAQDYPFGPVPLPAPPGHDPGRLRDYALFQAAYGSTSTQVKDNLEEVEFFGRPLRFNRGNGAAEALRWVAADLRADPEACAYMLRLANADRVGRERGAPVFSTWLWRSIAGTNRLSTHSYGIAIDLHDPSAAGEKYWLWAARARPPFPNGDLNLARVPWSVVACFERHGFIWGGKWHHFDTIHFEYRPEFLQLTSLKHDMESACLGRGEDGK